MKKSLFLSISGITLVALTATTLYAQTAAGTSLVDKMKAAVGDFTLAAVLNPGETGLKSAPIAGKKTGDILTAGEWNRVLELVGEGGSGGSASGGSGAAAFVTYKNFSGTTTTIGKSEGIKSVANANGTPNFLAKDTLITFDEPLLTGDYAVIVSPSEDLSSILSVSRPTLDWVCMWNKISDSSLGVRCAYPGYGAYGNSIVSVAVIKGVGGGGSSNSAPAFYKCTNAQSLDATNAPCYGASRNGGAGTNKYRVVSCSNTDASGTYTAGGLLNFGDFMANKWSFHINNSNIACTDGSVLVMDIQGGGSGGSAGWEDVPLTDTADFDDSCMYRYQVTYSAGGREPHVPKETYYYANGVSKTQLVWWLDNDSQLSTFHITASSKNIFRINGAPYNTVGGNPAVSIIKIEKLCGGGGGSGGGMSAPSVISCKKKNSTYATSTLTGQPLVKFTASDCGGTLPDASYNGAIGSLNVCNGAIDHTVYSGGSVNGPGVSFSFRGGYACTWSDGSGYDISVVYMK